LLRGLEVHVVVPRLESGGNSFGYPARRPETAAVDDQKVHLRHLVPGGRGASDAGPTIADQAVTHADDPVARLAHFGVGGSRV